MEFLVVSPQGLGDSLEATPIVAALKRAIPDASIDVVVTRPGPRLLFSGLPNLVRNVIYLPYWEKGAVAFTLSLIAHCRSRHYDASFLSYPAARGEYHFATRAFGARRRYAHRYDRITITNLLWLHTTLVEVGQYHNILRNLDLVAAAGFPVDRSTTYVVPPSWRIDGPQRRCIAIHPGSIAHGGLEMKRWPEDNFRELAQRLLKDGYEVTLISGPAERDIVSRISAQVPEARVFEGALDEVARFLSTCSATVSNDSGIAHLAAAAGAAVLALHGPTPVEFGPYGKRAVAFRPTLFPPCFDVRRLNVGCALDPNFACLKRDLPVDLVHRRLLDLLQHDAKPIRPNSVMETS
ncbi:lipopolysaccharide heptosyltransferase family protein [bacterium]|nr:MAG: lipopolysaccharide heptosyltransferase family protein [bacterium]